MKKLFVLSLFFFIVQASAIKADALTAYLFGRELGKNITSLVRSGNQYFRSKLKASVEIEKARQAFWLSYPHGSKRKNAEKKFQILLAQKDLFHLAIYAPAGISRESHIIAKLGGQLDSGIPKNARRSFFTWVEAVREFLGANLHYPGHNGEKPDLVIAGPAQLISALSHPDILKLYHKYKLDRDKAEFEAVGRLAEFNKMLARFSADQKLSKQKALPTDYPIIQIEEQHLLKFNRPKHNVNIGRSLVAADGKIFISGRNDAYHIYDQNLKKFSGKIGPQRTRQYKYFNLSSAISGRYMIIGDPSAIREVSFLGKFGISQRIMKRKTTGGAAYIYDVQTGRKIRTLIPDAPQGLQIKNKRLNQNPKSRFGKSVALYGPYAIVGAPGEMHGRGSARWGIDGHGAAYIFDIRTGKQIARLLGNGKNGFGRIVAIGETFAAVSATGETIRNAYDPRVHIYDTKNGSKIKTLVPPSRRKGTGFGAKLTIHKNSLFIGAPYVDQSVFVYDLTQKELSYTLKGSDYTNAKTAAFGTDIVVNEKVVCVSAIYINTIYCLNQNSRKVAFSLKLNVIYDRDTQTNARLFGFDFVISRREIYIGTPGDKNGLGNVYKVKPIETLSSLLKKNEIKSVTYQFKQNTNLQQKHRNQNEDLKKLLGTWKARYICSQGPTGLTLTFSGNDPKLIRANFRFYPIAENPKVPHGEIVMEGKLYKSNRQKLFFDFYPKRWIKKPANFATVGISGSVFDQGKRIKVRVKALGCRQFIAKRE